MTHSKSATRPEKPYDDFPLFAANNGQWAKKIKGRKAYFGSWKDDPKGEQALKKYHEELTGVPLTPAGLSIGDLCRQFLDSTEEGIQAGSIVPRTLKAYKGVTDVLVEHFGPHRAVHTISPVEFQELLRLAGLKKSRPDANGKTTMIPKTPKTIENFVTVARMVFKYAKDQRLIVNEVDLGPKFKKPSRKEQRVARAKKGSMMMPANEIHQLLDKADVQMRAMILLGVNCGYGNADVGQLLISAIDFQKGWVQFARSKTGIDRRCPLWPETLEAIRGVLDKRKAPHPDVNQELLFVTKYGGSWHKTETSANPVTQEFKKLLRELNLYRNGLGFYSLRRTFETIGGDSIDQVAVDYIMGHAPDGDDMAAVYRQGIFDARLQKVVDHVHVWLYPPPAPEPKPAKRGAKVAK